MPPPKSTYLNLQLTLFKILSITYINFLNGSIFCIWLPICTLKHSKEMFLKFFDLLHKSKKLASSKPNLSLIVPVDIFLRVPEFIFGFNLIPTRVIFDNFFEILLIKMPSLSDSILINKIFF